MLIASPKVAVVGAGYWGKNLVRTFRSIGALHSVCDVNPDVLARSQSEFGVNVTPNFEQVLADPTVNGVAIAAPAAKHYELARRALLAEKHVYVEKPLALHASEGQELVELAAQCNRHLMVGHILEYHPAILELKRLIVNGELGNIQYIYSSRLNLGKLRTEENILWSFAPHDISAVLFLLGESPMRISAQGGSYLSHNVDTTLTTCEFPSGVKAHIFVSWLHPFKEQKLTIVGGRKMAVFDDVEQDRKLVIYSHKIEWKDRVPVAMRDGGEVIPLPKAEPLKLECQHFVDCIRTGSRPRTDGESGARVLRVLEACEEALRADGRSVELDTKPATNYIAHPSAYIDTGCQIGEGSHIWHFSHIMSGARLGKNCNLGQNVVVSPGCIIGNNVKIQNNVSVYTGVEIEDDVFCGPSMVFTNVINPRSHVARKNEYKRTLVRTGASIGANATVVCGITLGRYCFIAAGATVTHDVPDHALMAGIPARRIGWMCYCGVRLVERPGIAECKSCLRRYVLENGECRQLPGLVPATGVVASGEIAA